MGELCTSFLKLISFKKCKGNNKAFLSPDPVCNHRCPLSPRQRYLTAFDERCNIPCQFYILLGSSGNLTGISRVIGSTMPDNASQSDWQQHHYPPHRVQNLLIISQVTFDDTCWKVMERKRLFTSLKNYCWCIFLYIYTLLDTELKQPLIWDTSAADTTPITL